MISISNLHKYYNKGKKNETYALQGVELSFDSTGLVCILGESGCGKTTLLNAIGGLDSFDEGSIKVDDETIKKYKMPQIEKIRNDKYGYIFQNYYLLSDRSVYENVMTALSMYELTDEEKQNRVDYVLDALGLTKYKKKSIANLSGGQQQRVSIARALVKSPEIILADEPTGNLDEENTLKIMGILKAISKKCLVILVTHEREMANLFADRIIEIIDGKICSDKKNESKDSYTKSADGNIYLADYKCETVENKDISLKLYQKDDSGKKTLKLKLVFDNGKIFVKNETGMDVLIESAESGFSICEGSAPKLSVETVQDVDFSLSSIKEKNKNKLPFSQIRQIAKENRRVLGKRQAFMFVTILVAAVMLTLVLADFINNRHIDKSKFVTSDSHVVEFSFKGGTNSFNWVTYDSCREFADKYLDENDKFLVYPRTATKVGFFCDEVAQTASSSRTLDGVCMLPIDIIDEADLVYGRMPESGDEVVVDKMVLDRFCRENSVMGNLYRNPKDFLGQGIMYFSTKSDRKIVGITDMGEPDVFMYKCVYLCLSSDSPSYVSLSQFKEAFPGKYDDVTLSKKEMLIGKGAVDEWINMGSYNNEIRLGGRSKEYIFKEKAVFDEDFYADMVLSDSMYNVLVKNTYAEKLGFSIYVYNKDDIDDIVKDLTGKSVGEDGFKVVATYRFDDEINAYKDSKKTEMNAKNIVTMVVFILSVIVVYFSMKNNISARKEQIIVYRLIGINPSSIIKSFILEMGTLTTTICLPAIFVTGIVLKTISNIKVLGISYYFSWPAMLILAAAMIFANIFVCYISVCGMIKKPPVRLQ